MADAKGSGFLLRYAEKLFIVVLVVACAGYAVWTFRNLTPASVRALQEDTEKLSRRMLDPSEEVSIEFPTSDQLPTDLNTPHKFAGIPFDPFQPPKETPITKIVQLMPSGNARLKEHLDYLLGKELRFEVAPAPGKKDGEGLLATLNEDGTVVVTAIPHDQEIDYVGTLSVYDANNNKATYTRIHVISNPPVALPPTLTIPDVQRRKITCRWEEHEKTLETKAPIHGWAFERQAEGEKEFREVGTKMRELDPNEPVPPAPDAGERVYVDETVQPSTTYTYRMRTIFKALASQERTDPSEPVTVTTGSDLQIALGSISGQLATFRVTKWVKDIACEDSYAVRAGERVGYNRNRVFPQVNEVVDFTSAYVLVDIQPFRQLQTVKKKVKEIDETGKRVEREKEVTWWENAYRAIVYNDAKGRTEIMVVGSSTQ